MENGKHGEVYNICSSVGITLEKLIEIFKKNIKREFTVKQESTSRPVSDVKMIGDDSKLQKLNWRQQIPLEKTASDTLDYFRKNGL